MVICLERGADLHMAQLMPLPLTASCFSKIQIGFTFLVPAHLAVMVTTFATAGPHLWNSLPVQLRNADITYNLFR